MSFLSEVTNQNSRSLIVELKTVEVGELDSLGCREIHNFMHRSSFWSQNVHGEAAGFFDHIRVSSPEKVQKQRVTASKRAIDYCAHKVAITGK